MVIIVIAALAAILYIWTFRTDPEPVPSSKELVSVISSTPITPMEAVLEARIHLPGGLPLEQLQPELPALGAALLAWDEDLGNTPSYISCYSETVSPTGDDNPVTLKTQPLEPGKASYDGLLGAHPAGYMVSGANGYGRLATVTGYVLAGLDDDDQYQAGQMPIVTGHVLTGSDKMFEHFSRSRDAVTGFMLVDPKGQVELELTPITRYDETSRLVAKATLKDITLLPKLEGHWQQVLSAYGYTADFSALLAGTIDGATTYNELHRLLAHIFQTLAVKQPMTMADGNIISWAGHSPRLGTALSDVRGEPINIQAAIRYHHVEDRTHIYLGSPLIYRDF